MRLWENWSPYAVLVEMQMGNSVEVPQNIKKRARQSYYNSSLIGRMSYTNSPRAFQM